MRAHTITTTARVAGRGRRKRTIVPRGILALSLAVVLFAATASSAGAGSGQDPSEEGPSATNGAGAKFKGSTDQGLDVTVRVGDDGLVNKVSIEDRVRCQHLGPLPGPLHLPGAARRVDADRLRRQEAQHHPPRRGARAGEARDHRREDLGHRVDRDRPARDPGERSLRLPSLQDGRVRLVGDARLLTRAPAMRGMECAQLS